MTVPDKTMLSGSCPLVVLVSASGGVGKSTLALATSWLSVRAGIDCCLLEADLQFGDFGFWLGLDDELPDLGLGPGARGIEVDGGPCVYKAPCFPEVAEEVADAVCGLVPRIRREHELVIADTGQFWSGLTASLVCSADIVALVVDQRPASVAGGIRAQELLERLGVPKTRIACVYNRFSTRAKLSSREVRRALSAEELFCVPDGRARVEGLVSAGELDELVESSNPFVRGVDALLAGVLPKTGVLYSENLLPALRKGRGRA